ncbi:MAG: phosphoribosylanthranilate isomerase [Deltaproteobacteria bacterium]|nr:phosphoribosylanthranilate isomerase [Deltaproteobacteria bacterium]
MIFVKVCGITNLDDALDAVEFGADAVGFNFYKDSPRYIDPERVLEILEDLPPAVAKVGVFVNEKEEAVKGISQFLSLDFLQFHGDETPYYCEQFATPYWKAFRLKDEQTLELIGKYKPDAFLIDAYVQKMWGGTGVTAHWDLAARVKEKGRIILAGGLRPENVEMAIATVKPYGIDVCSGVEEKPGRKDHYKLEEFLRKAKGATT